MTDPGRSNPFAPPATDVPAPSRVVDSGEVVDATRLVRFGSVVIDGVTTLVPAMLISGALGWGDTNEGGDDGVVLYLLMSGLMLLVWVALNGPFLNSSAQTLGKRLLGIQVVNDHDLRPASLRRLVLLRTLPIWVAMSLPWGGPYIALANCLSILRPGRRCLHDRIARTRVIVKPSG